MKHDTAREASETILATGVSPWSEPPNRIQSRRDGITPDLCSPAGAEHSALNIIHGLTPVAKIVAPLRGWLSVLLFLFLPTILFAQGRGAAPRTPKDGALIDM